MFKDLDLSAGELSDEQRLFAVSLKIGPTRKSITGTFDADGGVTRLEPHWRLEVGSARPSRAGPDQKGREPESLHGILLSLKRSLPENRPVAYLRPDYRISGRLEKTPCASRFSLAMPDT